MTLSQRIGDTISHRIALRWANKAFTSTGFTLTFTVKSDPDTQADAAAAFQKDTVSGTITVSGTNATVSVLPEDTNNLNAGTYYWDIQATDDISGAIRTVAAGTLALTRDVTREPGVTLDVVTVSPPLLYFSYQAYLNATSDDPVLTEAEWVMVTLTGAITSDTPPENTQYPWFDASTGVYSLWNGNAWVVTSTTQGAPGSATAIVTAASPSHYEVITGIAELDETHYLTPAEPLDEITWAVPFAADSRVGQIKTLLSTENIASIIMEGSTFAGASLVSAVANEAYTFQCVSTSGLGVWLRLA